ncbi:hypothetical protein Nmel_017837 [Mimus melanotis]
MAAPGCRSPPLPTWRRAALSSLARSRPYLYRAGVTSAPSFRGAAAMRCVRPGVCSAPSAAIRAPRGCPGGRRGAVSGVHCGGTRGNRGGLGAAYRAGPALSLCCHLPPQQQSVPGYPVRGGEGGAARQPCQEAKVRTAGPDVSAPASAFPRPCPARPHPFPPAGSWRRWSCRSASRTMTHRRTSGSPVPSGSPSSRSYPAFGPARPCSGPPRRRTAWEVQRAPAQWERLDGPSPWVLKHEGRCGGPRAVPTGLLGTAGERLCRMPRAVVRCLRAGSMDTRVVLASR